MKILYYDCFAGISGDMNLGAMLDLGLDLDQLRFELSKLGLDHEFELRVGQQARHGIAGTRVDVVLTASGLQAPRRGLSEIAALIQNSTLAPAVQDLALAMFDHVARAEAKVHKVALDQVHFHELGATDALVDLVGAAICRHFFDIDQVWASAVELGAGWASCAHGQLPVPAPATLEILRNVPTTRGAARHEATTPTGAAVLAVLVDTFVPVAPLTITATGYGIGQREVEIPNLLRVHLAQSGMEAPQGQSARLLQCNIDDMSAEMLGVALESLLDAGAMDVYFTPVLMKKNRPATCLSLLCAAQDAPYFIDLVFRHTTTLGIKSMVMDKVVLETSQELVQTPLGPIRFKQARHGSKVMRAKPELEDCRAAAKKHGLSLVDVYAQIGWLRTRP